MTKPEAKIRSYNFALRLIKFIKKLNQKDLAVQILSKQVIRSGTSIGANIIEAQAGRSKRDFGNFLTHALKSANETLFWLNLLKDSDSVPDQSEVVELVNECYELSNILAASIITLKENEKV
jgi:four helix bundle protein